MKVTNLLLRVATRLLSQATLLLWPVKKSLAVETKLLSEATNSLERVESHLLSTLHAIRRAHSKSGCGKERGVSTQAPLLNYYSTTILTGIFLGNVYTEC